MRGYVFMLEAALAGIILVGFMLFISASAPGQGALAEPDLAHVLQGLDYSGELRPPAYQGDAQAIGERVSVPGFSHSVQLCDQSGTCQGEALDKGNTMVFPYLLAGDSSFEPMEVRLYVAPA